MKKVVLIVLGVTVALFLGFLILGTAFTNSFYNEQNEKLLDSIVSDDVSSDSTFMPDVVTNYLDKVLPYGFKDVHVIKSEQSGYFRTSVTADWSEITANQVHTINQPGFVWNGEINYLPGLWVRAIDSYIAGEGNMLIKLNSSLTLSDASGDWMNISTLGRYVSEMPLFPMAILDNPHVSWQEKEKNVATMIFDVKKDTVKMDFFFNEDGLIFKSVTNDRFLTSNAGYIKTPYTTYYEKYERFDGVLIPTGIRVEWNLENRDFEYGRFEIKRVEYVSLQE